MPTATSPVSPAEIVRKLHDALYVSCLLITRDRSVAIKIQAMNCLTTAYHLSLAFPDLQGIKITDLYLETFMWMRPEPIETRSAA